MTHDFTLTLVGDHDLADEMVDRLYEAGCDDGTIGRRSGVVHILFSREAETLGKAIRSAIADVENAGFPVAKVIVGDRTADIPDAASRIRLRLMTDADREAIRRNLAKLMGSTLTTADLPPADWD